MTSILPRPSHETPLPHSKRAGQRRSLQEQLDDVSELPSRLPDVVARER